jgi:hypothetical protein
MFNEFFLALKMSQTNAVGKNKTHIYVTFSSKNRAVYEIMCENIVQPGRPQMTIRRLLFACRILKATNTHSEYVILIAFPQLQ